MRRCGRGGHYAHEAAICFQLFSQMAGHETQHMIALDVAKAIIETLEKIDIHDGQRKRSASGDGFCLSLLQFRRKPR